MEGEQVNYDSSQPYVPAMDESTATGLQEWPYADPSGSSQGPTAGDHGITCDFPGCGKIFPSAHKYQ